MGMIKIPEISIRKFEENYKNIFQSGGLAEGLWNKKLENYFENYSKVKKAIAFSSNGSGLLAILISLKRYRGYKNIFIQSNTMYGVKTIAISSGLNYLGAVSCSIPSLMPKFDQVKDFIHNLEEPKKTVFMLSHIGGINNPDILEISKLCEEQGVALIEDAAHSLGSTLDSAHSGTFGLAGVYSLYATKAIPAGEGGIALTNDHDLGKILSKFNIYDRFDQEIDVGVNFRISELQALLSFTVCEQSELIIENKSKIASRYIDICKKNNIQFVDPYKGKQRGNHYKFTIIAEKDALSEFKNIKNRTSSVYDYCLGEDPDNIVNRHICLPIWYGLEEEIIEKTLSELDSLKF
ncbi:DegT/DnrJ/EryC1/StrS family aminotransferase [Alphaproteobacteria bacterium]|nr:DegT/DnrJ/EryC1/StrS family aminotransferase [Alphaproteobacteria bacterium]